MGKEINFILNSKSVKDKSECWLFLPGLHKCVVFSRPFPGSGEVFLFFLSFFEVSGLFSGCFHHTQGNEVTGYRNDDPCDDAAQREGENNFRAATPESVP